MPYTRLDISDIELKLSVVDLGRDNEVNSPFNIYIILWNFINFWSY